MKSLQTIDPNYMAQLYATVFSGTMETHTMETPKGLMIVRSLWVRINEDTEQGCF